MAKKAFALVFGFLLIAGLFARSNAFAASQQEQGIKPGQTGQVGEPKQGAAKYDPFFGLLHQLNLTEAQKADVANVLKANEAQAKTIAHNVAQAGLQIRKDFLDGKFNREHFENWVKYEQEGSELRAKVMSSVLPKLNQQQQTALQDMQNKFASNLDQEINERFARLDDWIAQYSKG